MSETDKELSQRIRLLREQADDEGLRIRKRGDCYQVIGLPGVHRDFSPDEAERAVEAHHDARYRESIGRTAQKVAELYGVSSDALADDQAKGFIADNLRAVESMFNISDGMRSKIDRIMAILNEASE